MKDTVFQEIANEIKGLHHGALEHIKRGEYAEASVQYRKTLLITDKIKYYEGMAITLFSMANLAGMVGDYIEALNNAADAREMFEKAGETTDNCEEVLKKLALSAKKAVSGFFVAE